MAKILKEYSAQYWQGCGKAGALISEGLFTHSWELGWSERERGGTVRGGEHQYSQKRLSVLSPSPLI